MKNKAIKSKRRLQFFLLMVVFCISNNVFCQLKSSISFDTKGQQILFTHKSNPVTCIQCAHNISDNPINHFAIYSGIVFNNNFQGKYKLKTGLYFEERSFSGGNNTLENLVVFPFIQAQIIDTFNLFGKKIGLEALGGDFWNEDIGDILRIYNIDYHGLTANFSLNQFKLGFGTIGDLSQNIGLDLHQTYTVFLEKTHKTNSYKLSVTGNDLFPYPYGKHPEARDYNISLFYKGKLSKQINWVNQIETRLNTTDKFSVAFGSQFSITKEYLKVSYALRYYQANFNKGYKSDVPRYRSGSRFIGQQLYPLKNYYRNINQWAFLSRYQNLNILNNEVVVEADHKIKGKLYSDVEVDLNFIYTANDFLIFPFYNIGFRYAFHPNFNGKLMVTNKHMDLDAHYQTAIASRKPFFSYLFSATF